MAQATTHPAASRTSGPIKRSWPAWFARPAATTQPAGTTVQIPRPNRTHAIVISMANNDKQTTTIHGVRSAFGVISRISPDRVN